MATLGQDGGVYLERLRSLGISTQWIQEVSTDYTAQAMIMTDKDNNQITAFHPGAMNQAHLNTITRADVANIAIIAPDGRDAMIEHAQQLHDLKIPFVFDPGQGLPMFNAQELKRFIQQASWATLNDYEAKLLEDKLGESLASISNQLNGLVVTLGGEGCDVWVQGQVSRVAPVAAQQVLDPTGCGDAWRGGLLFGLERGWSLERCASLGNHLGSLKIAHQGPQNYQLSDAIRALLV
jgi:adenosine kinase